MPTTKKQSKSTRISVKSTDRKPVGDRRENRKDNDWTYTKYQRSLGSKDSKQYGPIRVQRKSGVIELSYKDLKLVQMHQGGSTHVNYENLRALPRSVAMSEYLPKNIKVRPSWIEVNGKMC